MNSIGIFGVNRSQGKDIIYGGNIYDRLVTECLQESNHVDTVPTVQNIEKSLWKGFSTMVRLARLKAGKDLWIRDFYSMLSLRLDATKGKNIALIHHIDSSVLSYPRLNRFLEGIFYRNLHDVDGMVVVSQFWRHHFQRHGIENIEIIYNPFDFDQYVRTEEEIEQFKQKYGLDTKPIIYLGNCQQAKGVVDAYRALKGLDVHLVTSGKREVDLPATHLELNFDEYVSLLHASAVVVTMSQFQEGWCRTAHEAMICKTPVVGSGCGGMGELLDGGGQLICKGFGRLRMSVEYALQNAILGEEGHGFATQEQFAVPYFQKKWADFVISTIDSH